MASSAPIVSTIFVLLMLLVATEMGPTMVAEAKTCFSRSHVFKGPCVGETNCASVCRSEGFDEGYCLPFNRRCVCNKEC